MGYDGVEFAGFSGSEVAKLKDYCAEAGVTPISAHVPYVDLVKDPEKALGDCKALGCRFVAVPYLNEEYRPGTKAFPEVVENIKKIGAAAGKLGITLLYHNHDFEFVKIDGVYALDYLYSKVGKDLLQTELDTCWVHVGGEDPASYIGKYSGRTPVIHFKDYAGSKTEHMYELIGIKEDAPKEEAKFEFRPVGSGKLDWPGIIKAAKASGAEWAIVEQDNPSMGLTSMESIEKSVRFLRGLGL
ncbi:MAG: sugar phosphate isomerase/epimerase [Clostridia bacterium]|nr:sugar phosphate isomerase/epimerase [Clostridia bacterium]